MSETHHVAASRVKHSEIVADGKHLEVLSVSGPSDRPAIVMLHEGLGSVSMWKRFPMHLAERTGCAVVAYSRYGHGKSEQLREKRSVNYMHHEGEVVLPAVLDQMGIERAVLLGHSDGGSIALVFAGTYPERVRALILEAPHVFTEEFGLASIAKIGATYETSDFPAKLSRYHDDADSTFWGWNLVWLDPEFRAWNIECHLSRISCPILVLQGEQDEYGTVAQVDAIRKQTPNTQVFMLPQCGHSPHRDQEQMTLDAVAGFLVGLGD